VTALGIGSRIAALAASVSTGLGLKKSKPSSPKGTVHDRLIRELNKRRDSRLGLPVVIVLSDEDYVRLGWETESMFRFVPTINEPRPKFHYPTSLIFMGIPVEPVSRTLYLHVE
jgi:hypothetical protein